MPDWLLFFNQDWFAKNLNISLIIQYKIAFYCFLFLLTCTIRLGLKKYGAFVPQKSFPV